MERFRVILTVHDISHFIFSGFCFSLSHDFSQVGFSRFHRDEIIRSNILVRLSRSLPLTLFPSTFTNSSIYVRSPFTTGFQFLFYNFWFIAWYTQYSVANFSAVVRSLI